MIQISQLAGKTESNPVSPETVQHVSSECFARAGALLIGSCFRVKTAVKP